jgi:hypothetical protein
MTDSVVYALTVNGNHLFAGTEGGVYRSTDNGSNWTQAGLTQNHINALTVIGDQVFAGTGSGVFLTTNNGADWNAVNNGLTNSTVLSFARSDSGLFAGTWGGVFFLRNKSDIWTAVNTGLQFLGVPSLVLSGSDLFAGTGAGGVWRRPLSELNISVTVMSPNGGENWKTGSIDTIKWISSNIQNINIEYSANGGGDWSPVVNTIAASPSAYPWTIPDTTSTNCLVRISDVLDANINDVSNDLFTIYRPSLLLTSPNGGESCKIGSIDTIKWTSSNIQNIKIEYSANGGKNWSPVVNTIAASPSAYLWTIPDTTSTNCLVRISDVLDANINDVSDSYFSIESFPDGLIFTEIGLPKKHRLLQNYPNPFNPSTQIKFALPKPENVKIEIYNTIGQRLETLINQHMPAGYHEIEFNAQNLSSGVYLYRIEAGQFLDVKKMILLR